MCVCVCMCRCGFCWLIAYKILRFCKQYTCNLFAFHVLPIPSFSSHPASFGVAVKCWWRRVSSVSDHVSIECQADPQGSMLECDLCHVHILPLNPAGHVSQTGCSHMSASFSTLMDANAMQDANCTLLCPGHTPGKTSLHCMVQEGCEY